MVYSGGDGENGVTEGLRVPPLQDGKSSRDRCQQELCNTMSCAPHHWITRLKMVQMIHMMSYVLFHN